MAKFSGNIGYLITVEDIVDGKKTGKWKQVVEPHKYYGNIIRNFSRWENSGNLNENISLNNSISIIADAFAYENFQHIVYVEYMNQKWKVNNIEVQKPRLILSLGGVYNEHNGNE